MTKSWKKYGETPHGVTKWSRRVMMPLRFRFVEIYGMQDGSALAFTTDGDTETFASVDAAKASFDARFPA